MKRIGFLMEKMMTEENFIKAERLLGKNKRNNRKAKKISADAEKYGNRKTVMAKKLMHRISRKAKRMVGSMNVHNACSMMSYFGLLKWCNSYNFRVKYIYPYVNKRTLRRIISEYTKKKMARVA